MVAIVGMFAFIAAINAIIPITDDDLCRAIPGLSLLRALQNTYGEYIGWSGRFAPMFLTYSFLSIKLLSLVFPLINAAAATLLLVWLPIYHSGRQANWTLWNLMFAWTLIWMLPQSFGYSVFFWTGAIQYLWSMVLALFVLWPYKAWYFNQPGLQSALIKSGHAGAAILLGSWMEHLAAGMIVFIGLLFAVSVYSRRPMPVYLKVNFVFLVIGLVFLVIAPGNYVRLEMGSGSMWDQPFNFLKLNLSFAGNVLLKFVILVGILALINRDHFRAVFTNRNLLKVFFFYFALALLISYALIGAKYDEVRSSRAFFSEILLIIPLLTVMPALVWPQRRKSIIFVVSLFVLIGALIQTFYWTMRSQAVARENLAIAARDAGRDNLAVRRYSFFGIDSLPYNRHINFGPIFGVDLGTDKANFKNVCAGHYYGLKSIFVDLSLGPHN